MKYWVLILVPIFLLIRAPDIRAHNLVTLNGNTQSHQHVYRRQQYGKPLQQGHFVKSSTGNGTVIWGSDMRPEYGKSNVRRSGPIIDGQKALPGAKPDEASKYGSMVRGYGKPVRGYGKSFRGYGKPDQGN